MYQPDFSKYLTFYKIYSYRIFFVCIWNQLNEWTIVVSRVMFLSFELFASRCVAYNSILAIWKYDGQIAFKSQKIQNVIRNIFKSKFQIKWIIIIRVNNIVKIIIRSSHFLLLWSLLRVNCAKYLYKIKINISTKSRRKQKTKRLKSAELWKSTDNR